MKHIITFLLFAAPFVVSAQETPKEKKTTNTPPSSEKSISEKGVSSTKSRGINSKKVEATPTTPVEVAPTATATTNDKEKPKK